MDTLSVLTFNSCSGRTLLPVPSAQCKVLGMINKVYCAMIFLQGSVWEKWEIFEKQVLNSKLISAGFYKGLKRLSKHFSSSFLPSQHRRKGRKLQFKKNKLRKNKLKYFFCVSFSFIKNERH